MTGTESPVMNLKPLLTASPAIQIHVASVTIAILCVLAILFLRRGSQAHRFTGRGYVAAMVAATLSSFWITELKPGAFSFVHLISVFTIFGLFLAVRAARAGNSQAHARWMIGTAVGGLGIAGTIAVLAPHRLMGDVLFG